MPNERREAQVEVLLEVGMGDAGREHGQIRAFNFSGYDATKTVPTVVLRNEDYGRITRIMAEREHQVTVRIRRAVDLRKLVVTTRAVEASSRIQLRLHLSRQSR